MASETAVSPENATDARRVLLNVVSPSAEAKRLSFPDTPLSATIGDIKAKIHDVVPSKPAPERQRLIYQGRPLVTPTATLASVFGQEASQSSDSFTLHLVLPPAASGPETNLAGGFATYGTAPSPPHPAPGASVAGHSTAPQDTGNINRPNPSLDPRQGVTPAERATDSSEGGQPAQNFGQGGVNTFPGQSQAAQGGQLHAGGHPLPPGMTTGFNPFPQHQQNLANFGNPFAMNEHMRRVFADHMHQHGGLRRTMAGQNASNNAMQNQDGSNPPASSDAATGHTSPRPESETERAQSPQNSGTTIIQEGHGPNGQWRMVVNQTNVPFAQHQRPHMAPGALPPPNGTAQISTHAAPSHSVQAFAPPINAFPMRFNPAAAYQNFVRQAMQQPQNSFPPMVYLLSSPTGYQAVLIPPGASYPPGTALTSLLNQQTFNATRATEVEPAPEVGIENDQPPAEQGAQPGAQPGARQDEAVDIFRIVFPLGGHLWLLIRLLGLVYLITGGATWTRTILLSSLALVVFIAQAGWLNPIYRQIAEPLRRHLEGVVRIDRPAPRQQAQDAPRQDQQAPQQQGQPQQAVNRDNAGPGVTPEQLAARLIRQREDRDPSMIRAAMRRFERSLALFIASLVPGVGEGHVQAQQEAEIERQRLEQEREVEERRRAEEERANAEGAADTTGDPSDPLRERSPTSNDGERDPLLAGAA